ncbi:MAG: aminotransferase class IV [Actinomycetota bacterium]|nr:aminotransferase class IV [Actinomycetota bacterium]
MLPGITRGAVMNLARDAGYDVIERRIDRSELYLADEVFLTGTGAQVAPVASIDDRKFGSSGFPVSLDIQARYFAAVRGTDPRYAHSGSSPRAWCRRSAAATSPAGRRCQAPR